MPRYEVSFGAEKVGFELPRGWEVLTYALPREIASDLSPGELFQRALAHPIGSPSLEVSARGAGSAAIVVDDDTRPTPVAQLLPLITTHLLDHGIDPARIHIVVAVGTHRPMSEAALRERVGDDVFGTFGITNHDSLAPDLVQVGTLSSGQPLKVNRLVAEADLRIGLGSALPHPANGFGGGPKLIFPGVSDYDAIHRHHIANFVKPHAYVGNLADNEFYAGIREAADMVGFDHLFNCVLDYREEIVDLVFGEPIPAFERAVELTVENCGYAVGEKADVTILSCFPYRVIPQIFKPLRMASLCTKQGGLIVLVAKNLGPLPEDLIAMLQFAASQDGDTLVTDMLAGKLTRHGAPLNLNFYVPILRALEAFRCAVVTREIPTEVLEGMGLSRFDDLQQAIDEHAGAAPSATAHVFSAGGMAIPTFPAGFNPNTLFDGFAERAGQEG
jgi:nickel-dependent lactate racemase